MANWKHFVLTNDELKELVRDVYDCKVFTSLQCDGNLIGSIFMPVMFLGASPSFPSQSDNIKLNRKNKLKHIDDVLQYDREKPERDAYLENIGMLYEDYSKAGPMAINGYPMFMSCKILSIEDTKRFREMYKTYQDMRENFEKEWGK